MKLIRIVVAALSLAAMTLALVAPSAAFCIWLGWLPRTQLVPAIMAGEVVALVVLALLVALCGRLYCAVVCPLGISQDAVRGAAKLLRLARGGKVRKRRGKATAIVRYSLLALFAAAVFLGFTGLIEPYGIFGRFLNLGVLRLGGPGATVVVWAVSLFAIIVFVSVFRARWWCNVVCPVGAFLGLFSRFAFFRVRIDDSKCVGCGICSRVCDKGAIVIDGGKAKVDATSCVACFDCKGACGKEALKWR